MFFLFLSCFILVTKICIFRWQSSIFKKRQIYHVYNIHRVYVLTCLKSSYDVISGICCMRQRTMDFSKTGGKQLYHLKTIDEFVGNVCVEHYVKDECSSIWHRKPACFDNISLTCNAYLSGNFFINSSGANFNVRLALWKNKLSQSIWETFVVDFHVYRRCFW